MSYLCLEFFFLEKVDEILTSVPPMPASVSVSVPILLILTGIGIAKIKPEYCYFYS